MILILCMSAVQDGATALQYLDSRNFIKSMFIFAIMVIAGTRSILQFAMLCVRTVARFTPLPRSLGYYFTTLTLVPLLGHS